MGDGFRNKRFVRFSIATLLFLMLCLGGYLSGYRVGYDAGTPAAADETYLVKTYSVADLVVPRIASTALNTDFDNLIDLIVATVSPNDWMETGTGEGEIQPFPTNKSLVVSQTQANQAAVAKLLERLRKLQTSVVATGRP